MSDSKFTDSQLIEMLNKGMSQADAAREFGVHQSNVSRRVKKLTLRGYSPEHDMTKMVPEGFLVKGVSSCYDSDGNLKQQWVKSAVDKEEQLKVIQEMCLALTAELPTVERTTVMNEHLHHLDRLAVYPLGDPHVGMMAWAEECGDNWDLAIAEKTFCSIFDRVVRTAPPCNECIILNLGDYFHTDNMAGVTSRNGHHLDTDGRYSKMVQVGVKIMLQMIKTALEVHRFVHVITLQGNHDDVSALFLAIALKHIYANEPRVIIDDSPSVFRYHRFGKVLIGAHHGHSCKMDRLPGVMAADKAKDWGETEFRYWLTGHIHHDSKKEFPGVMVESFRTLAARDSYATAGGWRSGRDTKCIVYHKEYGEIERHSVNINMENANEESKETN